LFFGNFAKEKRQELLAAFRTSRVEYPPITVFTEWDEKRPSCFSRQRGFTNSMSVIVSFITLATAARYEIVEALSSPEIHRNVYSTFEQKSYTSFNMLILIKPDMIHNFEQRVILATKHAKKTRKLPNLEALAAGDQATDTFPVTDFDVVRRYVKALRSAYGHLAMFCYDPYGGGKVAVRFDPRILDSKPLDAEIDLRGFVPDMQKSKELLMVKVDLKSIVKDFKALGQGLVERFIYNVTD